MCRMEPRFEGSLCVCDTDLVKQTCGGRLKGHEADKHQRAADALFVLHRKGAGYFITDAAVLVRGGFACMSAYKNRLHTCLTSSPLFTSIPAAPSASLSSPRFVQ